MMDKAKGHTHPIKKRRRHHAAADGWRRRVADVDHHQRVGTLTRHVGVGATHSDGMSLCAQHVTASARESAREHQQAGAADVGA